MTHSSPDLHSRILGTPTDAVWPGVSELPDFKQHFPRWNAKNLNQVVPKLSTEGCDVLQVSVHQSMCIFFDSILSYM